MFVFLSIALCLISLSLAYLAYFYNSKYTRCMNSAPGPPALPIIGNLLTLNVSQVDRHRLMREWAQKYHAFYRLWFGTNGTFNIYHPDDFEVLLTSNTHINKQFTYEHMFRWLGTGLLTTSAPKWHGRRKTLTFAFHFNILKRYLDITNEQGEKSVKNTRAKGEEMEIDLMPFCSNYTLNIICESAMGVDLDKFEDRKSAKKYREAIHTMGELIFYRWGRPFIKDWMIPFMPSLNRKCKETYKCLDGFVNKIVQDRREYHQNTGYKDLKQLEDDNNDVEDNVHLGKRKRLAMLDLLLAAERDGSIDDAGIREEVATFLFAGHDTTASALCFTIMLLAEHEDIQERARKEVEAIFERTDGVLKLSDLQEMSYLERCIKESLRLMAPVPAIARFIHEDLQFKHFYAPKGCNIICHFLDLHRNPEFWPDPMKYDPDRFLPENSMGRHPFAYIPFSAGPRNCIGQKFAMMELKSLTARILYNFRLKPIDRTRDVVMTLDLVLRPEKSIYTKFIKIGRKY